MKYLSYLLFVISFSNVSLLGQESTSNVKLEIGLRDELPIISTSFGGYYPLPVNFHLTGGIRIFEKYKLDFRTGVLIISSDFLGIDRGLFLQADLGYSDLYATLGIDFMNNSAEKGGEMSYQVLHPDITYYCFGLGYNINKHFTFDIMYYLPKDKVYTLEISRLGYSNLERTQSGGIVLGIQYSFYFHL